MFTFVPMRSVTAVSLEGRFIPTEVDIGLAIKPHSFKECLKIETQALISNSMELAERNYVSHLKIVSNTKLTKAQN